MQLVWRVALITRAGNTLPAVAGRPKRCAYLVAVAASVKFMNIEERFAFSIKSLLWSGLAFLIVLYDLVTGETLVTTRFAATEITRADNPVMYWFFVFLFSMFGILFLRSYFKDRKLVENKL